MILVLKMIIFRQLINLTILILPTLYHVIGLMSGTSLDGLDIAYCSFTSTAKGLWSFEIIKTQSINYTSDFKHQLQQTVHLSPVELLNVHNTYGSWLGDQVHSFIKTHQLQVDFIASHGHTVFHQPEQGITLQIGSGQHLANVCKHKVIADFRTNDVALGGQGAPLVPVGDQLLFNDYDFCLNLGGISNISFEHSGKRIAYDISPVNMLLNQLCKKINIPYDKGGQIAATGQLNPELLAKLNALPYYQLPYPKSLGVEWYTKNVFPILDTITDTVPNLLHTSVQHIATQIALQITDAIQITGKKNASVLITGGGAKNTFLIQQLQSLLSESATVNIPNETIIDFKEALIFAFMGVLRERKEVNCLQSVTGARRNSSSGVVFHPI